MNAIALPPPRRKLNTTVRIAAANSPSNAKRRADFVCDGANDHLKMQTALDYIATVRGVVQLEEGDFSNAAQLTIAASGVHLRGRGPETRIKPVWTTPGTAQAYVARFDGLALAYLEDVSASDFSIVTDAPFALDDDAETPGFIGVTWATIWAQYCKNFRFANLYG